MKLLESNKIVILMGGWNEESEVSLQSGNAVLSCLKNNGFSDVYPLYLDHNLISNLQKIKPDIVFNALHGKFGEDGNLQSILNFLQIPYTHSGLLTSAIGMDKITSAKIIKTMDVVKSPNFSILRRGSYDNSSIINNIGYPFVIKPLNSGSSVGVEIFINDGEFNIDNYHWNFGDTVIIEKYIKGQEVQVAVVKNEAIGAIEVRPKNLFYDYECKYGDNMTEYVMPADVDNSIYQNLLDSSSLIHKEFGCNNISRIDFIISEDTREIYFLELNTHPGLTDTSLVPKIAKYYNISFFDIIKSLLLDSKCDY